MNQKTHITYSFGPRETRGVVLGLRAGQLLALGIGVLGAVAAIRSGPGIVSLLAGLFIASLTGLVALMPVGHLTIEQWAPGVAGYLWRGLMGRRRWTSRSHLIGHRTDATLRQPQARSLQGVEIIGLGPIVAGGREMGYLKDRRRAAYVAVLAVRGDSFALLDRAEQDLRVGMWSSVIAGFGLRSSVIRRLQWVDRTLPEDREALDRYLEECRAPDADPEAVSSYRELIEQATSAAQRHEGFLVVQIDQRRVWKQARQSGERDLDKVAGLMLHQQLRELEEWLQSAELGVHGHLSVRELAGCLRYAFEPERRGLDAIQQRGGGDAGVPAGRAWPTASDERWAYYRTGRWCHATYYVEEWPRVEVGPDFLRPLLLGPVESRYLRTVSMTLEPVPSHRANREVRRARVADITDERQRQRLGQLITARQDREREHTERTERELADGHVSVRFAGYVTVTAPDANELENACSEVEQQAAQARLVLSRVYRDQELAFTLTLPICRGLP
jgi:hypothetical protein